MKDVHKNLLNKARHALELYLWTDCDREGENIAYEIAQACRQTNTRLILRRPRFSVINSRSVINGDSSDRSNSIIIRKLTYIMIETLIERVSHRMNLICD